MNVQAGITHMSLTYLEKDGTLQLTYDDPMTGKRNVFNLQKIEEKDQDQMLNKVKEKLEEINKEKQDRKDFEVVVTDKNTTMEQLQQEHPIKQDIPIVLNHKEYNPWEKYQ